MDFTGDWKSMWPISSTFSPPLFLANKDSDSSLGPLIFSPNPSSSTLLLHDSSLAPRLPPPYPQFSVTRFLQITDSVPSTVSALLGSQLPDHSTHFHGFNSLQLLQIPDKNLVIVFFPAGDNSDRVGFYLLSVKDGVLSSHVARDNFFQLVKAGNVNHQRITSLLVNPVDDFSCDDMFDGFPTGNKRNNASIVGFLMVCTNYCISWYRIGISGQNQYSVSLDYIGCANSRTFRGNAVVTACWSPHWREECLVLLENGDLLLFDVNSSSKRMAKSMSSEYRFLSKKMRVSLNEKLGLKEESGRLWFGCEFSWDRRVFIASNRNRVFLVDLRFSGEFQVCCLMQLDRLSVFKNDGFFALSVVSSSRFFYTVATGKLLLLCDVRKPQIPVLRWAHDIKNPRYIDVFKLSELRANARDTTYDLASESGHGILLGSLWDNEFSLFCYGPDANEDFSASSDILKSYYAWGFPSAISLSGSDCNCSSCVVREEFSTLSLPAWIDWRRKKDLVSGFGILHQDLYKQSSSSDNVGGFMIIRLTSSGKIESQHYNPSWKSKFSSESDHRIKEFRSEDNLLYDIQNIDYDGTKRYRHLNLDYLNSFLNNRLAKYMVDVRDEQKDSIKSEQSKHQSKPESKFHQEMRDKLKAFGLPKVKSALAISNVLKDVTSPTSIHEIALKTTYAKLSTKLLLSAFSTYSDLNRDSSNLKEPLEFLGIPDEFQIPPCPFRNPSSRSNMWSSKVQPPDALVGPIVPAQYLATLHKLWEEEQKEDTVPYQEESEAFSAHYQFKLQCDEVMEAVQEHISSSEANDQDGDVVSLADDDDTCFTTQKLQLSYHKASAFVKNSSNLGSGKAESEEYNFTTYVFRRNPEFTSDIGAEMVGKEIFDVGCPLKLKFNDDNTKFGTKELEAFKKLKKLDLNFQKSFKPYQDCINEGHQMK